MSSTPATRCAKCDRPVPRRVAVHHRDGIRIYCKKHADRIPQHQLVKGKS